MARNFVSREPELKILSMAEALPEYAKLETRLAELRALKAKKQAQFEAARYLTTDTPGKTHNSNVAALVGDIAEVAVFDKPKRGDAERILGEIKDIETAETLIEDERRRARHRASEKIIDGIRPWWDAKNKVLTDALETVARISKELEDVRYRLDTDNVSFAGKIPLKRFVPLIEFVEIELRNT